jgi:hypothetical protein
MVQSLSCCWMSKSGGTFSHYLQLQDASDCTTQHRHNPRRRKYESVSELAIFKSNLYLYRYPSNLVPVILPAYTTYDDGTECSETSAQNIQTSGSPKRNNVTFRTRHRFEIKNVFLALRSLTNSSTRVFLPKRGGDVTSDETRVSRGLIRTKIKIPQYVFAPNITLHCNSFVIHPFLHPLIPGSPDS